MTARDMLARVLGKQPRMVVLHACTEGRTITVVTAVRDKDEAARLIRQAGWEYDDITAAISLEEMQLIARAAK